MNNKIKSLENCKKVSFNREKLKIFDKEHIRAEHPSQYLSSNHYGFSP